MCLCIASYATHNIKQELEILQMQEEYKYDDEPIPSEDEEHKESEGDGEDEDSCSEKEGDGEEKKKPQRSSSFDIDGEIKKLSPDELRSFHSMTMTEELLEHTSKKLNNAGIHGLLRNVILRHMSHKTPLIRERAIHCLGLFCMLDKVSLNASVCGTK